MRSSSVLRHTVIFGGHKTNVSLEYEFWKGLREIAHQRGETLSRLVASIDTERGSSTNLSSAIRLFVLGFYRDQYSRENLVDVAPAEAPSVNSL